MIKIIKKEDIVEATKDTNYQIIPGEFSVYKKKLLVSTSSLNTTTESNDLKKWGESCKYSLIIPLDDFSSLVKVNFTDYTISNQRTRSLISINILDDLSDIEIEYLTKEEDRELKIKNILDE